jgi:hypothetical protein
MNVGLFYDWDLTLTEEYQQMPIFRKYFKNLQKKYGLCSPEEWFSLLKEGELGVSYMEQLLRDAEETFENLSNGKMEFEFAPQQKLSPGILDWFERINEFASKQNIQLEHHVISVGVLPLIKGTPIFPFLSSVSSGEFLEEDGRIAKIKKTVQSFRKVESLKKILKGGEVYKNLPKDKYTLLPENSIVLGDGQSDLDIFRYIKQRGGFSIGVFKQGDRLQYKKAVELFQTNNPYRAQVNRLVARDYSQGKDLETQVKKIILNIKERKMHCTMDYHIIHNHKLEQLQNQEINRLASKHFASCVYCQDRFYPQATFS